MTRILIVGDDAAIWRRLADNLEADVYEVITARDGEEGYRAVHERKPDLILLDLMLSRMGGYEVCRKLRADGIWTPILMLTTRSGEADRVRGLDLGADDFVAEPFPIREIMARIRALLRRAHPTPPLPDRLQFDGVVVDFCRHEARKDGARLDLTPKEYGLLRFLSSRAGQVARREELLDRVWGYQENVTTHTVDNHVAALRAKIGDDTTAPRHLITVHGVGYKFLA